MHTNYFSPEELACKCGRPDCDAGELDPVTLIKLNGVRHEYGKPIKIESGARCRFWNSRAGGAAKSRHVAEHDASGKVIRKADAVDLDVANAEEAGALVRLLLKHGFSGIGVPKAGFIHADTRPGPLKVFGY